MATEITDVGDGWKYIATVMEADVPLTGWPLTLAKLLRRPRTRKATVAFSSYHRAADDLSIAHAQVELRG